MALFLFLLLAAVALGIIGFVVEGLFYLLVIGVVVLAIDLVLSGILIGRRGRARTPR